MTAGKNDTEEAAEYLWRYYLEEVKIPEDKEKT